MYWKLCVENAGISSADVTGNRFVLHRHVDEHGPHFDLRLETEGFLTGWRIEGDSLSGELWATEKAPHAMEWLDRDGSAVRVDEGFYERRTQDGAQVLLLKGRQGIKQVGLSAPFFLTAAAAGAVLDAVAAHGVDPEKIGRLLEDGIQARQRASARLLGLARELDGTAFDEGAWRPVLERLSLDEIQRHLRAYEVRFDDKYPPAPVSRPEKLPDDESKDGLLAILHEEN